MAKNITTAAAHTIAAYADGILIQNNAALTGNIVVAVGGVTIATITDPGVGNQFLYGGLHGQGAVVVTPSTTCNITVSMLNRGLVT